MQNSGPSGSLFLSREDYSSVASYRYLPANNYLYFHQYNGKSPVTIFAFINIMERHVSDIFPPFVFNNIMEDTFIFSPAFFRCPVSSSELTVLISIRYIFARFSLSIANPFCLLVHNGKAGGSDHRTIGSSRHRRTTPCSTEGSMGRSIDEPIWVPPSPKLLWVMYTFHQKERWIFVHFCKNDANQAQKPE